MRKFFVIYLFFFLSSCSYFNSKLADYYFYKAKKISSKDEVTESEIEKFYSYIIKSIEKKNIPQAVEIVDKVTDASIKSGYLKAYDNQLRFYLRYIELYPYSWNVYLNVINIFSLRGDIQKLSSFISDFDKRSAEKAEFRLLSFITSINLLYWLESYGYLSLSDDYETMMDYLSRYCSTFKNINDIIILDKQGYFKSADSSLYYFYITSLNDLLSKEDFIKRNCTIAERMKSNSNYAKIIRFLISGNKYLSKQEYSNAVIYYRAALNMNEGFIEAKKGLIEAEFQNALSLSLMKKSNEDLIDLIHDRIFDIDEMISERKQISASAVPFVSDDKLISSLYTLKSAMLSVLYENEKQNKTKQSHYQSFLNSVNEALKYDPTNRLARELYERFVKR